MPAAPGRWPWATVAASKWGKILRGPRGFVSPTRFERRRPVVAWPRWSAEMAGDGRGGGVVGSGKGLEVGEGVVGVEEALSLPSPWAETSREGGSTEAGGGRPWSLAWWRCVAWAKARGGGGGCEDAGRRGGLFVGAARRWRGGAALVAVRRARRGALMAFGRYRGVVERRHGRRGGHRTTGRLGQARAARRAP